MMDALQILEQLNRSEGFPAEAIHAARADREAMTSLFIGAFEDFVSSGRTRLDGALFFAFHLLGEWRVRSAYRVLTRFLRMPDDVLEPILGDAKAVTAHRVMAAVFDGDPESLRGIVYDVAADEFIRSRMIDAIAVLTLRGDLSRAWSEQFMRECYDRIEPQEDCYAWAGWQGSIAALGFADLKPLVEQAFARGSIDKMWLKFTDFEADLQYSLDHPDAEPAHAGDKLTLFGDTIEELSTWAGFKPETPGSADRASLRPLSRYDPERNPFRKVGRNDPCPCGSGKKFKKCCLNADQAG